MARKPNQTRKPTPQEELDNLQTSNGNRAAALGQAGVRINPIDELAAVVTALVEHVQGTAPELPMKIEQARSDLLDAYEQAVTSAKLVVPKGAIK